MDTYKWGRVGWMTCIPCIAGLFLYWVLSFRNFLEFRLYFLRNHFETMVYEGGILRRELSESLPQIINGSNVYRQSELYGQKSPPLQSSYRCLRFLGKNKEKQKVCELKNVCLERTPRNEPIPKSFTFENASQKIINLNAWNYILHYGIPETEETSSSEKERIAQELQVSLDTNGRVLFSPTVSSHFYPHLHAHLIGIPSTVDWINYEEKRINWFYGD